MAQFFTGRHEVPVDDKGRIFVPAEFRKKLPLESDDTFVVMRDFDGCLEAYPQHIWEEKAAQLHQLRNSNRKVRDYIRWKLSYSAEIKMDRQGRVSIPRPILAKAGITDQMVIIGALDKLEFWSPENSEEFSEESPPLEDLAEFDIEL